MTSKKGLPIVTSTSPRQQLVDDIEDTTEACVTCGSTNVTFIEFERYRCPDTGYLDAGEGWLCANGHFRTDVDLVPVEPAYLIAQMEADLGPYDWPGDTERDEAGRAA